MEKVIKLMASLEGRVSDVVLKKLREILLLSWEFSFLEKKFTFDGTMIGDDVNRKLVEMSDEILAEIDSLCEEAIDLADKDADKDTILAFVHREEEGMDVTERIDSYSSHAREALEAYIAICFANKVTLGKATGGIMEFLSTLGNNPMYRKALSEGGYASGAISRDALKWGKGVTGNPIKGATIVGRTIVDEAYQKTMVERFAKEGAVGYTIHRGSDYPCALCDDVCYDGNGGYRVYGFDEPLPVPVHPHCVCFVVPVT